MKQLAVLLIGFAALSSPLSSATADIYQWKDASGKTIISDTPPPGNSRGARTFSGQSAIERAAPEAKDAPPAPGDGSKPPEGGKPPEGKPPAGPKTVADKELDFRKRQQEAKEAAEKKAKEEAKTQEKQRFCQQAQRNLDALQSGRRMISANGSNGELMGSDERSQETARLTQQINENCN